MPGLRYDFSIKQGATLSEALRWMQDRKTFIQISAVTRAAPAVATTAAVHGVPDRWPVYITGAKGMTEINSYDALKPHRAITDGYSTTQLEIMNFNSLNLASYAGGGVLEFYPSQDLTPYLTANGGTAELKIRPTITDTGSPLDTLDLTNSGILIDTTKKKIVLQRTAVQTAAYNFPNDEAWYDLELRNAAGEVKSPFYGRITLHREVTR